MLDNELDNKQNKIINSILQEKYNLDKQIQKLNALKNKIEYSHCLRKDYLAKGLIALVNKMEEASYKYIEIEVPLINYDISLNKTNGKLGILVLNENEQKARDEINNRFKNFDINLKHVTDSKLREYIKGIYSISDNYILVAAFLDFYYIDFNENVGKCLTKFYYNDLKLKDDHFTYIDHYINDIIYLRINKIMEGKDIVLDDYYQLIDSYTNNKVYRKEV